MKPSERIKQLATDIRNTDMLGNRLATSHTPKKEDYIEAIIQFLDEAVFLGKDEAKISPENCTGAEPLTITGLFEVNAFLKPYRLELVRVL
jgi:hypothetical protein